MGRGRLRATAALSAAAVVSALVVVVAAPSSAAGATYFVAQGSSCSDSGPGSSGTPFCTIGTAARVAVAGDTVRVGAGHYPEQVSVASGTTYTADDPAHPPVLDGADSLDTATWAASGGTTWSTVLTGTATPLQVFGGSSRLTQGAGPALGTARSWFFDTATRTLYVDLGGPQPSAADALAVSLRAYGFLARSTNGAVIDGFALTRQNTAGVMLDGSTSSVVRGVQVTASGTYGINDSAGTSDQVTGSSVRDSQSVGIRMLNTSQAVVSASTSADNGFHGVSIQGGSGALVSHVTASGNLRPGTRVAAGIDVSSSSLDAVVERSTTFGNDDSGIEIYTGSSGGVVRRNVSYDNGDHGIDISKAPNADVVANTVVGSIASGINVEGASTGTVVSDNITVDNALASPRSKGNIRVDQTSVPGTSIDRDLAFRSSGAAPVYEWNAVTYTSLASLRSATGQETHGLYANPQFVSLSPRDLRLTPTSPAVDAADSSATGWVAADYSDAGPVDQPAVANTGTGPTTFADLGARELTDLPADAPPTAALSATPDHVQTGQTVTLDASGSKDDRGIASYAFRCDTGAPVTTQAGATITCQYAAPGTATPSVTVTDTGGHTASASTSVTVSAVPSPTAHLTVTPSRVRQGETVHLDASASTVDPSTHVATYAFGCGSGAPVVRTTPPSPAPTAPPAPAPSRSSSPTSSAHASAPGTQSVTVTRGVPPVARVTVSDTTPRVRQRITVSSARSTGSAVSAITAYRFRCGTAAAGAWTRHASTHCAFGSTGAKTIRVWARNSLGLVGTTSRTVRVHH